MKPELVSKERIEELALEEWKWDRDHNGGATFGGYTRTARAVLEELKIVKVEEVDPEKDCLFCHTDPHDGMPECKMGAVTCPPYTGKENGGKGWKRPNGYCRLLEGGVLVRRIKSEKDKE